eukprot:1309238-Amphidinium_carterae.1
MRQSSEREATKKLSFDSMACNGTEWFVLQEVAALCGCARGLRGLCYYELLPSAAGHCRHQPILLGKINFALQLLLSLFLAVQSQHKL